MASVNLIRSCLDSIHQISEELKDAVLYVDAGCIEAFQFIGAFEVLLEVGVRSVCDLETVSKLDIATGWDSTSVGPAKKMVVITSRLLSDAHRYVLRCLSTHRSIVQCNIFTSISEIAHSAYIDSPLGPDAYHEYETLLLQDYEELVKTCKKKETSLHQHHKKKPSTSIYNDGSSFEEDIWPQLDPTEDDDSNIDLNPTRLMASVHHFPMIMCPISERVFVLPSEGTVSKACLSYNHEGSLSPGLPSICTGTNPDGDDVPPGITLTANFLYNLAAKMDLKLEIFSLGDSSKVIGKMLTDMSSLYDVGRRNKRSAGLLLIDRTLDIFTPCSHGDSFLDRMISSLPLKEKTNSSLSVKSLQSDNLHPRATIQRPSLDMKISFDTVFDEKESIMNKNQLSENIVAFVSGWNLDNVGENKNADLADLSERLHDDKLDVELHSLLSGSLLSNYMESKYVEALIDSSVKDGPLMIKKWLLEALQQEKVPIFSKSRVGLITASELQILVKKLGSNQLRLLKYKDRIKLAIAAIIVLSEPRSSKWDAFVSAERILNVSSTDTSQSLSSQIRDFINTSTLPNSLLAFQDSLLLTIIGYILAGENFPTSGPGGPFSWEEEHHLKEAVVDAILENNLTKANLHFLHGLEKELEVKLKKDEPETSKIDDFDDQWGSWDDEDTDQQNDQSYNEMQLKLELRDRVDNLFKMFHLLSGLKWRHPSLKGGWVASSNFGGDPYARKGLIYKVLSTVLAKYDIPGLEYHSSAVGRFLKSGFGRFGLGQVKPNLGDQSLLLIFVVGGINTLEFHEAMEAVSESSRPDIELILGGTTLLTPNDMYELLLGSSSYI